ncbi:39S ribosomal protein L10, mitochondrial-like [Anthonomus grandis grandis]|uniref:39S ribosomal protein L10, mitochondrial-like n=1 Tax=Anthonomus grandis grandis TaxID=2921223 RepID=UPI002165C215|nr:39S ribosomal protein L10, mitochondrial-like [Anthonomus grandis grandis]
MALYVKKATCEALTPLLTFKRFRGKINVQRPQVPHFEKAKFLALTKPWFLSKTKGKTPLELCTKDAIPPYKLKEDEENMFQKIIAQEVNRWFHTSKLIGLCHLNPMPREQQFNAFKAFKLSNMHFRQYGKKTLEMAIKGTKYETVLDFYVSRNMLIFSPEPEIKQMLKILKKFPAVVLMAGIYENRLVSKDDLQYYSTIPSLEVAQAGLVQTLNAAGSQLVSNLNAHQTTLVSHLEGRAKQLGEEK